MMKMNRLVQAICLSLLLAACGQHKDGDAFVGTWKKVSGQGMGVVIERNGDGYLVKQDIPLPPGVLSFPATVKGGAFQIQTGLGPENWAIDVKTGHLVLPGEVLERVSK
ncbi:hypothetical protein R75461_07291 [Paraburkholderia nemoris]|uniref:hypothetical protein n=1 Tax=Paraburkholderia nemoris TaxID=2793076 RepID=UPI00190B89B3|nr:MULTISPECIES: hypothetical protein [Paraburkholderia]MBK3786056.1 hypothetical protein [Paraburkholderia aspalathi]CAE6846993.1 hypothetical protein R75461_07291 [Paraburkholderia nemoris]